MALVLSASIELPRHDAGGFDHADVHLHSGRLFIAHTANGTVEVVDGPASRHLRTLPNCPEASGVLCAQTEGWVFTAARGAGHVLVIDAVSLATLRSIAVGPRPNGLAWDPDHRRLLVADVADNDARLVDPAGDQVVARAQLPGRPRWAAYDQARSRFLVNVRDPALVALVDAGSGEQQGSIAISSPGPHGLDLDEGAGRAFVACDGGQVAVIELRGDRQVASIPISGVPDAIWFNRRRHRLYVAMGNPGLIEVVDCERGEVCEQVQTELGAHTTGFDSRRQLLYILLPQSCRALVLEER
jgi:DNA-binding beta-propeller fold protein YncE